MDAGASPSTQVRFGACSRGTLTFVGAGLRHRGAHAPVRSFHIQSTGDRAMDFFRPLLLSLARSPLSYNADSNDVVSHVYTRRGYSSGVCEYADPEYNSLTLGVTRFTHVLVEHFSLVKRNLSCFGKNRSHKLDTCSKTTRVASSRP